MPVSCRLSATGIRFLGHPDPAEEFSLPYGRPTSPTALDPNGVSTFRTHETRPGWAPSLPRGGGVPPTGRDCPRPAPAASQRPALHPAHASHLRGPGSDEASTKVHSRFTRPIFLSPVASRMERGPFGFPLELRTPPLPATHAKAGTGLHGH